MTYHCDEPTGNSNLMLLGAAACAPDRISPSQLVRAFQERRHAIIKIRWKLQETQQHFDLTSDLTTFRAPLPRTYISLPIPS
jgi:hypothetical protein